MLFRSTELNGKYRFEATLSSQLGVLPSYTALGMASLLPHKTLGYRGTDVLVDGQSSVASQRDLFNRELQMEASELQNKPDEERKELELIYRAKGLDRETAKRTAEQMMADPKIALDTLAREELGLNPDELGSPVKEIGRAHV